MIKLLNLTNSGVDREYHEYIIKLFDLYDALDMRFNHDYLMPNFGVILDDANISANILEMLNLEYSDLWQEALNKLIHLAIDAHTLFHGDFTIKMYNHTKDELKRLEAILEPLYE